MKRVLFFPGAFNPPHYGHISAIEIAVKEALFDEIWIMPSGNRNDKTITINYKNRRNLGNLFIEYLQSIIEIPMKLITTELDDMNGRFTHEILKEIKSQPDVHITQLIGLDGYLSVRNKAHANERFIIIKRPGYELPINFSLDNNAIMLSPSSQNISSTQIRQMVHDHDDRYKNLVPEKIATYIDRHGLYRSQKPNKE